MEDYDAVIVGAGIGGLALGYGLASNGRKVCVLEARREVTPSKRGLTLQPNGLETLQQVGFLDRVLRIGAKTTHSSWDEIREGPLATFYDSSLEHPQNYLVTVVPGERDVDPRVAFATHCGVRYT